MAVQAVPVESAQAQSTGNAAGLFQSGQQQNLAAQQLALSSNLATYQPLDLSSLYGMANSNTNNFVGYGQQNANTLYNGSLNAGIAGSNQNASLYGGLLGLGGNLLGKTIGNTNYFSGTTGQQAPPADLGLTSPYSGGIQGYLSPTFGGGG